VDYVPICFLELPLENDVAGFDTVSFRQPALDVFDLPIVV
jgi:hypothetical protein